MNETLHEVAQGWRSRLGTSRARLTQLLATGLLLLGSLGAQAQLTGTKAIPGSGSTGYATLAAAITDLNAQGVGVGGVTFNLAPGYTETAANLLITATGTAANPILFQKGSGAGANPTITASVGTSATLDAIIGLQGADYVTFDGLTLLDPASNTTATTQMEWGFALLKMATPTVDGCQNVVIRNCVITLQKGTLSMGIYANNHTPAAATQLVPTTAAGTNSNNKFYGNTISGVNNGIYVAGYAAASPYATFDQNNEIGSVVSGSTATGNTITDFGTTATAYGLYTVYQNGVKVQGNTVASTVAGTVTAPTSTVYGILIGSGGNADLLNNVVTVNTNTLTSTTYGIQNNSGSSGTGTTVNIAGNSLTMTSSTATTAAFYGLYNTGAVATLNISGNTLSNWSRPAATSGSNYMLYVSTGATTTQNVFNNTLNDFTTTGASASVYCIYAFNNTSVAAQFYGNTMQNITCAGNTVYGLYLSSGNTLDVYRNRISGLTASGTSANIYGIFTSGTTTNITNNLVGDFSTPSASSGTAQVALYLSGGTTVNAQYNSIYLNGTSTGANFSTTGIYFTSTATTLVTLRNNLVINTTSPTGTGSAVALRRSSGTAGTVPVNLTTASNNNLYYAGPPTIANLIYAEGTSLSSLTNAIQTLTDYKSFMAGREPNSVTENVPFVSTSGTNANFLKIPTTTPTQVESGGAPISGITTDYAGNTRSTTSPDLGAYEGTYQPLDLSGPVISGAVLGNTSSTTNRTLVVTIIDPSGVATGTSAPRLYYRKGTTGAFVFVNATSVSGNQYTFTLDNALLSGGSVAAGDVIQFYVAAQDLVATANVSTSPGGGSGVTPPGTTAPTTPGTYQIVGNLSGIYYVGTGTSPDPTRTYATLTAAANAYNLNVLTGATTFYLLDATYSTAETFPITFNANPAASAANTLRISPYTGVNAVITGTSNATAVVLLNTASYITFDGSNTTGGTTRNLSLTSANGTANAVVWVGSRGSNAGATNITLRNLNLTGGGTSNSGSFGIYASAAPALATTTPNNFTYGDDNDNLVIQNNAIGNVYAGIYARAIGVATSYDGLQIVENRIGATLSGTSTVAVGNVSVKGIDVQGATAPLISRNFILGMDGTSVGAAIAGIELNANVTNAIISRNSITGLRQLNTGGWGAFGINFATTTNIANAEISNNVISDLLTGGYISSTADNPFGIHLTGGTGTKVYYNAVNLTGSIAPTTFYPAPRNITAALMVTSSSVTGLDVRDNIFANAINSSAATSTVKSYAAYYTVAGNLTTSDYNDYFVSGANGVLGYVAADVTTLADLKNATTKDVNSLSVDPVFVSATNLLPASGQLAIGGTPLSVTVDYTGAARPATAPSIGAYQFTPQTTDVAANALVSPVNAVAANCFGANTPVTVQIRNNGLSVLNFATNPLTVSVVIAGPAGSLQTLTQTINSGTLAATATQNITLTSLANFTPVGVYTFAITATVTGDANTSNDLLAPAPTLTVAAPIAGTLTPATTSLCMSGTATLTLAGAANGSSQFQSATSATGTFTDIAGATAATYTTPVLTSTAYYRVRNTCGTTTVYSNVTVVTVNNPVITAAPSPLSVCAGGTVTLTATAPTGTVVRYFTTATGGTALGTGTSSSNSLVSPVLPGSTTFYAEASLGTTSVAGLSDNSATNGTFFQSTSTDYPLGFGVTDTGTLTSVDVYPTAAGALTIRLYSVPTGQPAGAAVAVAGSDVTITVTAAQVGTRVTVPLNYALVPGDYKLSNAVGGLGRYSIYAGSYPLSSLNGALVVKGSYTFSTSTSYSNGTYNSFFNLTFSNQCVAATRTPIQVNVTPGLVASLPVAAVSSCGQTPYQLAGTISGTATGATYTSTGTGTFSPNAVTLNAIYTPSAADVAAGTVTLTLTPTGPTAACTTTGQVVLTLATPPNAAFSYSVGIYCTGSSNTVAPVLAAGAVAGTFSTNGAGLRLDPVTGAVNLATQTITGTYTVTNTITTPGVCNGTSSTATITILPGLPAPTLSAVALAGGGVQLTTNPVAGVLYQFFINGVAVGPAGSAFTVTVPSVPVNGSYTVVLVVPGGCSSAPSTPALVTATTASRNGVSLRVYPNPTADGQLTVELQGPTAKASPLIVLNPLGQQVYRSIAAAGTVSLDLGKLTAGVYTVRVQTTDGVLTQRVVRE